MLRHSIIALALSAIVVTALAAAETVAAQSREQAGTGTNAPDRAGSEPSGAEFRLCPPGRQNTCAEYLTSAEVASNPAPVRETRAANANAPLAPTPSRAQASDAHDWTGFYIGVNLGGMWGKFSGPLTIAAVPGAPAATTPFRVSSNSFTGGGQVGYNWEINRTVIGIESDFNGMTLNRTQTLGATAPPAFVPGDFFSACSHFTTSIRGRFGYTWNNWLLYGTGGVAFARTSVDANFILIGIFPASSGTDTNTLVGGTGGAGAEYALTKHWSAGAEYRYSGYQNATFHLGTVAAFGPPFKLAAVSGSVGLRTHEVAVKLNYKF